MTPTALIVPVLITAALLAASRAARRRRDPVLQALLGLFAGLVALVGSVPFVIEAARPLVPAAGADPPPGRELLAALAVVGLASLVVFAASLLASLVAATWRAARLLRRRRTAPHGPFAATRPPTSPASAGAETAAERQA